MKRIDKYDLTTAYGVQELCKFIVQQLYPNERFSSNEARTICLFNRLMSDVPTKKIKRWETYNGDFVKAETEFVNICEEEYTKHGCTSSCSHNSGRSCFGNWLMEEVEVEVEE